MGQEESLPVLPPDEIEINLGRRKLDKFPYFVPPEHKVQKIDLNKNKIRAFPTVLKNLIFLNCANNNIGQLLQEMPNLNVNYPQLQTLNLSDNNIGNVLAFIDNLKSLQELALERNKISEFNLDLPNLKKLDLLLNDFVEIPKLPDSLETLNIGFNNIRLLSCGFPNLVELRLSGNEITEITEEHTFPNLKILDLSFNRIYAFPPVTHIAPKLEVLILSFNMLDSFPTHIPLEITKIDVSNNAITNWDDPVMHLVSLNYLDISNNLIAEVPELPPNLEVFVPHHNKIRKVYPLTGRHLKSVYFTSCELSHIPDASGTEIENIHIDRNIVEAVDTDHASPTLKRLYLANGFIGELPPSICELSSLALLDLSGNHIFKLPEELGRTPLMHLLLSENPLSSLPALPPTLNTISLCKCQFTEIPESIYAVPHLARIDFSCNRLRALTTLPEVPYINLNCNSITALPQLPESITSIQVAHNKLKRFTIDRDYNLLQEIDVSHNLISFTNLKPMHSLKFFKLAFNPLKIEIDFSMFPALDCLDVTGTSATFKEFALPSKLREIAYSDVEFFRKHSSAQSKLFETARAGYSEACGTRPTMEDALIIRSNSQPALFGVVDGHGGFRASTFAAYLIPYLFEKSQNKSTSGLSEVIKKLNDRLRKLNVRDGATLVLALVSPKEIGCAHLGDARALVVRRDGTIVQLTSDHKAIDRTEFDLVKENRAFLKSGRLMGTLAVSRAIGDFAIGGVMRIPSMTCYTIKENDIRLVLACDGIFDVMTNDEVGRFAAEYRDMHYAAAMIRNLAFARGSTDNLSVVVVDIEQTY